MTVRVSMSREDIDGMYELATKVERDNVRKVLCARVKAIRKKQAVNQKVKTRKATHRNGQTEYDFYNLGSFTKLSDAAIALHMLLDRDHMSHLTSNKGKYEVWTRSPHCGE